jgi:hypothetical protein
VTWARRHLWWAFLLLGAGLVALFYALPHLEVVERPAEVQSLFWVVIPLLSLLAMATGIMLQSPPSRAVWAFLAVGVALTGLGDTLWEYPEWVGVRPRDIPYPSVLDYLYLASYLFLFAAIVLLVRRRSPGRDRAALLDAFIVTTAALHHRALDR